MDTWSLAFISAAVAKDLKAQDTISWAKSRTTTPSATKLHIQLVQDSPPTGTISGLVSPNQYATGAYVIDQGLVCSAVRGYNLFAENTELPFDKRPLARDGMYAQYTARRTRAVAITKEADEIEDSLEGPKD
ncbi:hypothetical protein LTR17_026869 [Elasticomyces elasticus]|nr:hypothetical protein LTR17_026869 [Elasticomyces elasticus]